MVEFSCHASSHIKKEGKNIIKIKCLRSFSPLLWNFCVCLWDWADTSQASVGSLIWLMDHREPLRPTPWIPDLKKNSKLSPRSVPADQTADIHSDSSDCNRLHLQTYLTFASLTFSWKLPEPEQHKCRQVVWTSEPKHDYGSELQTPPFLNAECFKPLKFFTFHSFQQTVYVWCYCPLLFIKKQMMMDAAT